MFAPAPGIPEISETRSDPGAGWIASILKRRSTTQQETEGNMFTAGQTLTHAGAAQLVKAACATPEPRGTEADR